MLSKQFMEQAENFRAACVVETKRLLDEGQNEAAKVILDASVDPDKLDERAELHERVND